MTTAVVQTRPGFAVKRALIENRFWMGILVFVVLARYFLDVEDNFAQINGF